jgi:aldehyde:ferredoxin oxidoreductase
MADLKGMTGKIARVNLTTGEITTIEPAEELYRKYLGGSALGVYYLFKEGIVDPAVDPLGPDNMLQFMIGPTTGAGANARSTTVTKSAYNFISIATSGGQAASELKYAGWDGIQIVGKADKPVYIAIIDDNVEIRDASHVWGKGVDEAEMILKKEVTAPLETKETMLREGDMTPEWAALRPPKGTGFGAKRLASVWLIGQGGENQVWYANVMTEGARAHGRYGPGAIMGSKNLKAVVIRGTKGHKLADKKKFVELTGAIQASERQDAFWREYGTAGIGANTSTIEDSYPIRNWQWCSWSDPNVRSIEGAFMDQASFVSKAACPGCFLHCLYTVEITSEDPMMDKVLTDMPDWEAMGMVGGQLGYHEMPGATPADPFTGTHIDQAENLAKVQFTAFLHDNYGLDYIEGGALLGMLMELRQRDLISVEDLDGIDLKWGDVHAVDELLKKIVNREGIGDVLATGTYNTAQYFAEKKGNPEIMTYHVTTHRYGQPAHDVRSGGDKNAMEYVTVGRPSEHTGGGTAGFVSGDYAAAISGQDGKVANDSLVCCIFPGGHWAGKTVDLVKAATGWSDFAEEDLIKVGARTYALTRLFDIHTQQLTDPKEQWDKLVPERWFRDATPNGPLPGGKAFDGNKDKLFNEALPAYWKLRGWTEDKGIPTEETLKNLGIDDIAADIAKQHL